MEETELTEALDESQEIETEVEETTEETNESEYVKGESADKTAERLLKGKPEAELSGDEAETPQEKPQVIKRKGKKGKEEPEAYDPELQPPQTWNAYEQQLFNKLPKDIKKVVARREYERERQIGQKAQQLAEREKQVRGLEEAISPYITEWGQRGLTAPQALAEFGAVQRMLTNEETKLETYARLGQNIGVSPEEVIAFRDGEGQAPKQRGPAPEVAQLQGQLGQLQSYIEQQDAQRRIAPIVAELDSVRQERDAAGNFNYPELFDPAFIERIKPLVLGRLNAHPGLSLGDALKLTHYEITGRQANGSASGNQTRLSGTQSTNNRAAQAAVSVRGRSAPLANGSELEAPPEAYKDARASMDWVMRNFR